MQDLRESRELGALGGELLDSRDFCVARYLPQALSVADVDIVGTDLVVVIEGDGSALDGPGFATLGTCPA